MTDPATPPGMPRWVKVFGVVVGGLVLLFVVLKVAGIGNHGPGMHGSLDVPAVVARAA